MIDLSSLLPNIQRILEEFRDQKQDSPFESGFISRRQINAIVSELLRLTRENAELRTRIGGAHVYRVDYKDGAGIFELDGETDFDILERLNGKRVALVPVEE